MIDLIAANRRYLRRTVFKPYLRGLCIMMIVFYQKHLSRHTCLYRPTCSEYTKRCINNWGILIGILLGIWRILRCNPLSKGGFDPAPEFFWRARWLV
ncbi:MAG: membrane protein insertion efficiency factor YidD [Clostridia bacterium]|nr:membrane protein insertion efficiency factor YidD [Clostridia bacterium]